MNDASNPNKIEHGDRGDKTRSDIYVISIQILFSVIIGVSIIDYHTTLVPFNANFETFTIVAAYSTVLMSLVGYSIAIKKQYHKNVWRFVLDVILLYLYFQLVYSLQEDFIYFLFMFPFIYGIYLIWQYLEYKEWGGSLRSKFSYSIPIFAIFVIVCLYEVFFNTNRIVIDNSNPLQYQSVTIVEWIIMCIVFALVFGFRVLSWKAKQSGIS